MSWVLEHIFWVLYALAAMMGFLVGYAEGLSHRFVRKGRCTDCGTKYEDNNLCDDCQHKLWGEMAQG